MPKGYPITNLEDHFYSLLVLGHEGGHWSLKCKTTKGYHHMSVGGGRLKYGHVVSYELLVGPVPGGYEVDHICRVKWCCNPAHLEAVTHKENIRRRDLCGVRDERGRYIGKR